MTSPMKMIDGHPMVIAIVLALAGALTTSAVGQQKKRDVQTSPPDALVTPQEAAQLEAVINTDLGVIRFEFLADVPGYDDDAQFHLFENSRYFFWR